MQQNWLDSGGLGPKALVICLYYTAFVLVPVTTYLIHRLVRSSLAQYDKESTHLIELMEPTANNGVPDCEGANVSATSDDPTSTPMGDSEGAPGFRESLLPEPITDDDGIVLVGRRAEFSKHWRVIIAPGMFVWPLYRLWSYLGSALGLKHEIVTGLQVVIALAFLGLGVAGFRYALKIRARHDFRDANAVRNLVYRTDYNSRLLLYMFCYWSSAAILQPVGLL